MFTATYWGAAAIPFEDVVDGIDDDDEGMKGLEL